MYTLSGWSRKTQEDIYDYFQLKKVPLHPNPRLTTYVFFDDAQDTYSDNDLWNNFFKDVESTNFRVVLFCSYGSPASRVVDVIHPKGTPTKLRNAARMSLRPSDDNPGLLLSHEEYKKVLDLWKPRVYLDSELQELIYGWTEGHVGAVSGILHSISNKARHISSLLNNLEPVVNFAAPKTHEKGQCSRCSNLLLQPPSSQDDEFPRWRCFRSWTSRR